MRLIDVADLEKFIRENVCVIGDDHLLLVAGNDGRWHEALPPVKTSYDVDKVVERLKKVSYERFGNTGMGGEIVVNLDDAIEIVKAGGKDE